MSVCMCLVSVVCSCVYILCVWGMFMCLYICMWGYFMCLCVCMFCMSVYLYVCVHVSLCGMFMCLYVCGGMFMCLCVCVLYVHVLVCMFACVLCGGYVHVFIHVCGGIFMSLRVCMSPFLSILEIPSLLGCFSNFPIKNFVEIVLILKKFTLHPYFSESLFQTRASLFHLLKAVLYAKRLYRQ